MRQLFLAINTLLVLAVCGFETVKLTVTLVSAAEVAEQLNRGLAPLIMDARTPDEFVQGHIPDDINLPPR